MGFLSNLVSATVKVALTPVAVVKDVVDVASGNEPNNTGKLIESVGDNLSDAGDNLSDGNLI